MFTGKKHYGIVEDKIPGKIQNGAAFLKLEMKDSLNVVMFGDAASSCYEEARKGSHILFHDCRINEAYNDIIAKWFTVLSKRQYDMLETSSIETI
jgi:hypothetical protein